MPYLILIVDDEPMMREVLGDVMTSEGYRVRCAKDGQEALEVVAIEPPDLIVSDVAMPGVDGVELVRRLRGRGADVPVVLISGHAARVKLPGVRFIRKPFEIDHLIMEVSRALSPSTIH